MGYKWILSFLIPQIRFKRKKEQLLLLLEEKSEAHDRNSGFHRDDITIG